MLAGLTDLVLVLLGRGQELSTPGAPFGVHGWITVTRILRKLLTLPAAAADHRAPGGAHGIEAIGPQVTGWARRGGVPSLSAKRSHMACHERASVGAWYCTPGMPRPSAAGLVKLWAAPP